MNVIKSLIGFYFNLLSIIAPKMAGKQSFYFFCIPFKAKLKPKQQQFLDGAAQKTLTVDDKKIQTYSWGEGSNIVLFVHGWQSNTYRWKSYIENLDLTKNTVIGFDAPGHGNSEGLFSNVPLFGKAIKATIDHYGIPNTIVSHSIGAFSSMYFMHQNKVSVDKFISLATPFTAGQFTSVFQSELKVTDKVVSQMKDYFKVYTSFPIEYYSLENFGSSVDAKSLLIHDKNDESTTHKNSEELHEMMPHSELRITEGYGHSLRSKKIVDQVCAFVSN